MSLCKSIKTFLFSGTLGRGVAPKDIPRPKKPLVLPKDIRSEKDLKRLLQGGKGE